MPIYGNSLDMHPGTVVGITEVNPWRKGRQIQSQGRAAGLSISFEGGLLHAECRTCRWVQTYSSWDGHLPKGWAKCPNASQHVAPAEA